MSIRKRWLCLIICSASYGQLLAQDADSILRTRPDAALTYHDSLDIFYLIDSLLTMEENIVTSKLGIGLNYNSNVLYAGQTLGINNFGLSPGVSYYHKIGVYANLSAYWSQDFEPNLYLATLSVGYMHTFTEKFSIDVGYDRYFPINNDFFQYKNTLSVAPYLDLKPITLSVNYSYYFTQHGVHRIMPSISLQLEKKKLFKIDNVSFTPTAYLLLGNDRWTEYQIIDGATPLERFRNYQRYGTPYRIVEIENEASGIMNYTFSFPLTLTHKNWRFLINYTYSIPKSLDKKDPLVLPETGFIAAGLTYYLNFRRKLSFLD
jgi:hypothetical protein